MMSTFVFLALCAIMTLATGSSCSGRCGENYDSSNSCHCNDLCGQYGNCCGDYDDYCSSDDSCNGRCGESYDSSNSCHCNDVCGNYGNCCTDYDDYCTITGTISRTELSALAENLWSADNRLSTSDYIVNRQTLLSSYSDKVDLSSSNFFSYLNTADTQSVNTGTFPEFKALLNNYVMATGTAETVTGAETTEMETFMDEVMATSVMTYTYNLLSSKGYFSTTAAFRDYVESVWCSFYSRSSGTLDSSAFEHTFVGEIKNSAVSGFHNWYQFYLMEQTGELNYYGYVRESTPNQILLQFSVNGYVKTLSSIMLGVSPEFELALYTVCFLRNPNGICEFDLQGNEVQIQTYDYTGGYIGSAYFNV